MPTAKRKLLRRRETAGELESARLAGSAEKRVEAKPDDSLFAVDRAADAAQSAKSKRAAARAACEAAAAERKRLARFARPGSASAGKRKRGSAGARAVAASEPALVEAVDDADTSFASIAHASMDLWAEPVPKRRKRGDGHKPPPLSAATPYDVKALQLPHSGQSYHPSAAAHSRLYNKTLVKETQDHYKHVLAHMMPAPPERLIDWEAEESKEEGKLDGSTGSSSSGGAAGVEDGALEESYLSGATKNKKKNRAARNKQRRHKLLSEAQQLAAQKKKWQRSFSEVTAVKKQLEAKAKLLRARRARRARRKALALKTQMPPVYIDGQKRRDPVEVALPEELTGSLRTMKRRPLAYRERLFSLARRRIVDMPRYKMERKVKTKTKFKWEDEDGNTSLSSGQQPLLPSQLAAVEEEMQSKAAAKKSKKRKKDRRVKK